MVWKVPGTTILPFLSRWNEGLPYITSIHHTNCSLCGCYAQRECDSPTMFFIGGVTVLWDTTYKSKDIPERWASKNLNHYVYIYYVFSNLFIGNSLYKGVMSCDMPWTWPNSQNLGRKIAHINIPPSSFARTSHEATSLWTSGTFESLLEGKCRTYVSFVCAHIEVVYELQAQKQTCRPSHTVPELKLRISNYTYFYVVLVYNTSH